MSISRERLNKDVPWGSLLACIALIFILGAAKKAWMAWRNRGSSPPRQLCYLCCEAEVTVDQWEEHRAECANVRRLENVIVEICYS